MRKACSSDCFSNFTIGKAWLGHGCLNLKWFAQGRPNLGTKPLEILSWIHAGIDVYPAGVSERRFQRLNESGLSEHV
jgi:hypothetical protein